MYTCNCVEGFTGILCETSKPSSKGDRVTLKFNLADDWIVFVLYVMCKCLFWTGSRSGFEVFWIAILLEFSINGFSE